jgi:GTP cyclohydrolase II
MWALALEGEPEFQPRRNPRSNPRPSTAQAPTRKSRYADFRGPIAIGLGGQILSDLGIHRIRLLSNTPMHIPALEGFGLEIVEQVAIPVEECGRAE